MRKSFLLMVILGFFVLRQGDIFWKPRKQVETMVELEKSNTSIHHVIVDAGLIAPVRGFSSDSTRKRVNTNRDAGKDKSFFSLSDLGFICAVLISLFILFDLFLRRRQK
ncbi:MAG: hypothetical protein ACTSX6_01570 [Candidatus Heimdallarchaeaceae archaeon]